MKFYSTSKKSKPVNFQTALLTGLADDGGLYMPAKWPRIMNYESGIKNFEEIISKFVDISEKELKNICDDAFNFPVPLVKLDKNLYILELFHGPTFSFKDFGARFMARAMNYYLVNSKQKKVNRNLNIVVATSGDTGSAVASGFYGLPNIKVFVLYPSKRISALQEKQIATLGGNIVALEVKGDFDDCQKLAKTSLADENLRKKINLSSANSINIGRLLPQMFYYFKAYYQVTKQLTNKVTFVVPSGNFGNLTAGLFAKKLGLPVKKFIAAVNKNSVIPDYLNSGKFKNKKTTMTLSNAMDVGNPSNWARIMDLYDGDRKAITKDIEAIAVSEAETKKTIAEIYKKYNYVCDPHTAVGLAAALKYSDPSTSSGPMVVLATAHPAKFKETVESAIGKPGSRNSSIKNDALRRGLEFSLPGKKIPLPAALEKVSEKPKQSIVVSKNYEEFYSLLTNQATK